MIKENIKRKNRVSLQLEYDNTRFSIEYLENFNTTIIRRLSDNQVLFISDNTINYIIQHDNDDETNFIIIEPSKNANFSKKFKHYTCCENSDKLKLEVKFKVNDLERIKDDCYSITSHKNMLHGKFIYNPKSKLKSDMFYEIYSDEESAIKIQTILNSDDILVSEKITPDFNGRIYDIITYGIDPNNFQITTPIYSSLQNRLINIYTTEQLDEIDKKLLKQHLMINRGTTNAETTIRLEVKHYLTLLSNYLKTEESVYRDVYRNINKEFVNKFTKKQ